MSFFKGKKLSPIDAENLDVGQRTAINMSISRLNRTHNPMFAWEALSLCIKHDAAIPSELLEFLERVSESLVALGISGTKTADAEIEKAVFAKSVRTGTRSPIRKYFDFVKDEALCLQIENDIFAQQISYLATPTKGKMTVRSRVLKQVAAQRGMPVDTLRRKFADWEARHSTFSIEQVTAQDVAKARQETYPAVRLHGTIPGADLTRPGSTQAVKARRTRKSR